MTYISIEKPLEIKTQDVQLDAFSRLRVSQLNTLFNLTQLNDNLPLLVDEELNGTATSTHSAGESSTVLATSAPGDYAIRQTKQRFYYQAGKSQLILLTFSGFQVETNIEKLRGYFSAETSAPYSAAKDGLFLMSDAGGISINIYKSGTQIEKTYQSSFNIDTLDGAGLSGLTVDWSKNQILVIDFQYLGVGRVRWYLDIDGQLVKFHESNHANSLLTSVYMSSPNQPLRSEIRQTGAGSGSFRDICASVSSEGSLNELGTPFGADSDGVHINCNNTALEYLLLAVRLKTTRLDAQIRFNDFNIFSTTNDSFLYRIRVNPTFAGSLTWVSDPNSAVEYAIGATAGTNTVTAGQVVKRAHGTQQLSVTAPIDTNFRIGSTISGVSDIVAICVKPLTSNADLLPAVNWKEFI